MSAINPNNIDSNYPIAGQDNPSQGFRDNFTNIKNNLALARDELTELQNKAILKLPLTGGSIDNNFKYQLLTAPQFSQSSYKTNDLSTLEGPVTVSCVQGEVQIVTLGGNITSMIMKDFAPSGQYSRLVLMVYVSNPTFTLKVPDVTTIGLSDIKLMNTSNKTISFNAIGFHTFEFSTYDNGGTLAIRQLTNTAKDRTFNETTSPLGTPQNLTTRSVILQPGGDEQVFFTINANCVITLAGGIVNGSKTDLYIKSTGTNTVTLPNNLNNKASSTFTIAADVVAKVSMVAFGNTASSVVATITNS